MENFDFNRKQWDLNATSPPYSSATSLESSNTQHGDNPDGGAQPQQHHQHRQRSRSQNNTDDDDAGSHAGGGGYMSNNTGSPHSQQSTPTTATNSAKSNVTTIKQFYSTTTTNTNEVTLIDLTSHNSMPPPPPPPPPALLLSSMPATVSASSSTTAAAVAAALAASVSKLSHHHRAGALTSTGGAAASHSNSSGNLSTSSSSSSDGTRPSLASLSLGGAAESSNNNMLNNAQNYFRTRDHAYAHQYHPPIQVHYPPLQPIRNYNNNNLPDNNNTKVLSAPTSTTQLPVISASSLPVEPLPNNNNHRPSFGITESLLNATRKQLHAGGHRKTTTQPLKASASATTTGPSSVVLAAVASLRSASLSRRVSPARGKLMSVSIGNNFKLASANNQQHAFNFTKRFSEAEPYNKNSTNNATTLSPRSLSSNALPTSVQHASLLATDEVKAQRTNNFDNFRSNTLRRNNNNNNIQPPPPHQNSSSIATIINGNNSKKNGGNNNGSNNFSFVPTPPAFVPTPNSVVTTTNLPSVPNVGAPVTPGNAGSDNNRSSNTSLSSSDMDATKSEKAAATVRQIIQHLEQQIVNGNGNLVDADKQLDDLEKALEANSPILDSGGMNDINNASPPVVLAGLTLDAVDNNALNVGADNPFRFHTAHHDVIHTIDAVTADSNGNLRNNNNNNNDHHHHQQQHSSAPTTVSNGSNHGNNNHGMQQGQRLLRMIGAEKQRTNAERDKLKRALAERDTYREHYVSICEASKRRRMQLEELEERFALLVAENAELRKKVAKHRHSKRRVTLELDTQIAAIEQQYADELHRQRQKRHHERRLRLRQEKEIEQLTNELQSSTATPPPSTILSPSSVTAAATNETNNKLIHEKCQETTTAAVKAAVESVRKSYDAELEELDIQNVALLLENRDLKHANAALRHNVQQLETKLSDKMLLHIGSGGTASSSSSAASSNNNVGRKESKQRAAVVAAVSGDVVDKSSSLPNSPTKKQQQQAHRKKKQRDAGAQTEEYSKELLNAFGSGTRDASTSMAQLATTKPPTKKENHHNVEATPVAAGTRQPQPQPQQLQQHRHHQYPFSAPVSPLGPVQQNDYYEMQRMRQQLVMSDDNGMILSDIYSDENNGYNGDAAGNATARRARALGKQQQQRFASSTPQQAAAAAAVDADDDIVTSQSRHMLPLQSPPPSRSQFGFNERSSNNNNNKSHHHYGNNIAARKPLVHSLSTATGIRAASSTNPKQYQQGQHGVVGALRQQLLLSPSHAAAAAASSRRAFTNTAGAMRQIVETSFITNSPRTHVRQVASDDYMRAACTLANTTMTTNQHHHVAIPSPPPKNNKHDMNIDAVVADSTTLTGAEDADVETDNNQQQRGGDVASSITTTSADLQQQQQQFQMLRMQQQQQLKYNAAKRQQQQLQSPPMSTSGSSCGPKRRSRRHVYELMEDAHNIRNALSSGPIIHTSNNNNINNKAHGDSPLIGCFGLTLPKGVASVAARRLERKSVLRTSCGGGAADDDDDEEDCSETNATSDANTDPYVAANFIAHDRLQFDAGGVPFSRQQQQAVNHARALAPAGEMQTNNSGTSV